MVLVPTFPLVTQYVCVPMVGTDTFPLTIEVREDQEHLPAFIRCTFHSDQVLERCTNLCPNHKRLRMHPPDPYTVIQIIKLFHLDMLTQVFYPYNLGIPVHLFPGKLMM